jgi:hydrogenase maturation factor
MVSSCALCGDTAVVARVVAVVGAFATVEADGCTTTVAVELVPDVRPGDRVLCHAGVALQQVDA